MQIEPVKIGACVGCGGNSAQSRLWRALQGFGTGECEFVELGPPVWGEALWRRAEEALLEGRADAVAMEASEIPARMPFKLRIAGALKRSDPRSLLITRPGERFATLPLGAHVAAVGALRRAQVLRIRPDFRIERADDDPPAAARGVGEGRLDGALIPWDCCPELACQPSPLPVAWFLPQPGQAAVALLAREDDKAAEAFATDISHEATLRELTAERSFAVTIADSGARAFGALASASGAAVRLAGAVFSDDGSRETSAEVAGPSCEAEHLGRYLAEILLSRGEAPVGTPPILRAEASWPTTASHVNA